MTLNFADLAWDTDAMEAITRLAIDRRKILNPDYFHRTVHHIEECLDPSGKGPLTLLALAEWEAVCLTAPKDDHHDQPAPYQPRRITPAHRLLPNTAA